MRKFALSFLLAFFAVFAVQPAMAGNSDWDASYLGMGVAQLTGNAYKSRTTPTFLQFTLADVQHDHYGMELGAAGEPRSESRYGDARLLFWFGFKHLQFGTGLMGYTLDAKPRQAFYEDNWGVNTYDPHGKLEVGVGAVPVGMRLILWKSEDNLLRFSFLRSVYGYGSARIPVLAMGRYNAYVETNHGHGRAYEFTADYFERIYKHLFLGLRFFYKKAEAWGMEYKDTFLPGFINAKAPDTNFRWIGGCLLVGVKW